MCLIVDEVFPCEAKQDFEVYKVLREYKGKLYSEFYQFKYEIGKTYYGNVPTVEGTLDNLKVNEGFHSFMFFMAAKIYLDYNRRFGCVDDLVIVKCTVPKGSKFFKGEYWGSGCVSSSIRVDAVLETEIHI